MISPQFYSQLVVLGLLWRFIMLHLAWPSRDVTPQTKPSKRLMPRRKRSTEPKPLAGLTQKPPWARWEQATRETAPLLPVRPNPMPPTHRRPRTVDTSRHFCPHAACAYRGGLGLHNLRANGHPSGGPWRQWPCRGCPGYCLAHHGTICHGKQAAVELIVPVLACLAEGRGSRATARVFEVDAHTVLHWLVEAAEPLRALSAFFLCDLHVRQLQLDELSAVLRDVKAGALSEDEAITPLERSPYWVWPAMDPESQWLLVIDVGTRTLAMAQRVLHQVVQVGAPHGVPLCLTDGLQEYGPALLTPCGLWSHSARRRDKGPPPHTAGDACARPPLCAGGAVLPATAHRRRQVSRSVGRHGAGAAGTCGVWPQEQYRFCLPHARLRQLLPVPEPTTGRGSAKVGRPCTPAMVAGLTEHVWSRKEVWLYRVPPGPTAPDGRRTGAA